MKPEFDSPTRHFRRTPHLREFPREVIRNIALHIYDPLLLTQQDRLSMYPSWTLS